MIAREINDAGGLLLFVSVVAAGVLLLAWAVAWPGTRPAALAGEWSDGAGTTIQIHTTGLVVASTADGQMLAGAWQLRAGGAAFCVAASEDVVLMDCAPFQWGGGDILHLDGVMLERE